MKKLLFLPVVSALLLTSCNNIPKEDKYGNLIRSGKANVILITGQSNASGYSESSFLQSKNPYIYNKFREGVTNVFTSYYAQDKRRNEYFEPTRFGLAESDSMFGPEIGVADVFSEANGFTYIIKFAVGATKLQGDWLNSNGERGRYYNDSIDWFQKRLNYLESRGVEPNIIGQFWMQGEADSTKELCTSYGSSLKNLISFYRNDLQKYYDDHYTFVDACISAKTSWPNPEVVNEQKQKVSDADPNVFCIKTNGEDETALNLDVKSHSGEGDDTAHYDSQSQVLLGQRAGQIIRENIGK